MLREFASEIQRYFTQHDGSYLFARWGRPIVPIVFGVDDATLAVVKGAFKFGMRWYITGASREFEKLFRQDLFEHLLTLKGALRSGGQLVLETLVVEGGVDSIFVPPGRYAKMRNVWFIPSPATLERWMQRCGLKNIRVVDENVTSLDEQRSTDWMTFESLPDYLDPADRSKTVEGYPAPKRAVVIATA